MFHLKFYLVIISLVYMLIYHGSRPCLLDALDKKFGRETPRFEVLDFNLLNHDSLHLYIY